MQWLDKIFDVFSRRPRSTEEPIAEVTDTFRNRVIKWCAEVFSNKKSGDFGQNYSQEFWTEIHGILQYRHGTFQLSTGHPATPAEDAVQFLAFCPSDYFLNFLEDIFRVECLFHVHKPKEEMVNDLNYFFKLDNLPYFLTDYVTERVKTQFHGREHEAIKVSSYPRVAVRGNQLVHDQAIKPALELLQRSHFKSANSEFLEALEDYRKGNYRDCLTKCGSAFESVLKVLCDRKGWPYNQTDTASPLVKTLLSKTSLDSYFEPLLMILPTLRNKLSKSHGAGKATVHVPQHIAQYAINATASAILLIVYESGEK